MEHLQRPTRGRQRLPAASGQEGAHVEQLPGTVQWLNQVVLRVHDIGEPPDYEDEATEARDHRIEENATTRCHGLHIAVLQRPLVQGAGDVECLVVPIGGIRERDVEAG
jgi:hypothetical protein